MLVKASCNILEYFNRIEDDGKGPGEHDEEEVGNEEEERSSNVRPREVPDSLRHGQSMALLLHGFLYLTDLLTDVLSVSSHDKTEEYLQTDDI